MILRLGKVSVEIIPTIFAGITLARTDDRYKVKSLISKYGTSRSCVIFLSTAVKLSYPLIFGPIPTSFNRLSTIVERLSRRHSRGLSLRPILGMLEEPDLGIRDIE